MASVPAIPKQILAYEREGEDLEVTWVPWVPGVRWVFFSCLLAVEATLGWQLYLSIRWDPGLEWLYGMLAISVSYLMLVVARNRMCLRLRGGHLIVEFGPVPTPLGLRLDAGDLVKLEVEVRRSSTRSGRGVQKGFLYAELAGGERRKLMSAFPETAEFLEAELRQALESKTQAGPPAY